MRGVGGAVVVAVGFGLGLMGAAWAQPAPPAGGSKPEQAKPEQAKPEQAKTSAKMTEGKHSRYRRATNLAARKFFKAANDYYDSRCKLNITKEEQDKAKAAMDAAQTALDEAIAREADEAPAVTKARAEVVFRFSDYLRGSKLEFDSNFNLVNVNKKLLDEAEEKAKEARAQEEERIRQRINDAQSPAAPRQTSCGPGGGNTSVLVAARPIGTDADGQIYRTVRIELRSAEPRLFPQIAMGGSATSMNVPTINAGTVFTGGAERPIITSAGRLTGGGGFLSFSTPGAGPIQNFVFTGTFDQANASNNGFVAPGTSGVAQTYIIPNPVSGSTGINAGATGQTVSTETQWREFSGTIAARSEMTDYEIWRNYQIGVFVGAGLHYRNARRTDSVTQQSINFAGLNSVIDLTTTSNFIAPHFSAGIVKTAGGPSGPIAGLSGFVAPGARMTSANAAQNSNCTPCGGGSPERSVTLQRDFSETKFAVVSGVSGYLGYQVSPSLRGVIEASYENQTATPVFGVPTTPVQQPIALNSGSIDIFRVGGKISFIFPPPAPSP